LSAEETLIRKRSLNRKTITESAIRISVRAESIDALTKRLLRGRCANDRLRNDLKTGPNPSI
jgi:hypothetical protein